MCGIHVSDRRPRLRMFASTQFVRSIRSSRPAIPRPPESHTTQTDIDFVHIRVSAVLQTMQSNESQERNGPNVSRAHCGRACRPMRGAICISLATYQFRVNWLQVYGNQEQYQGGKSIIEKNKSNVVKDVLNTVTVIDFTIIFICVLIYGEQMFDVCPSRVQTNHGPPECSSTLGAVGRFECHRRPMAACPTVSNENLSLARHALKRHSSVIGILRYYG